MGFRRFGRSAVGSEPSCPSTPSTCGSGASLVSLPVCTNLDEADGPEADILNEMGRFQSAARSLGLIATALDVPSRSLTIGAAALGFDFVQSPLIASYNVGITLGLTTFGVADLYQEWLEPA